MDHITFPNLQYNIADLQFKNLLQITFSWPKLLAYSTAISANNHGSIYMS